MRQIDQIEKLYTNRFSLSTSASFENGYLCIDNRVACPVHSGYCDKSKAVDVFLDNARVGEIIFLKGNNAEIASLPDIHFICLLSEYPNETLNDSHYQFLHDYVLIEKNKLPDYLSKKVTSAIWGNYFHIEDLPGNYFNKYRSISRVDVEEKILIPLPVYYDVLESILREGNPFTRFLKQYHLLELQFDIHTAEKIKNLLDQGGKEKEISKTLKDYSHHDIERLTSLISTKLKPTQIIPLMNNVIRFKAVAGSMFYEYGKESNPLKEKRQFDAICAKGGFEEVNIDAVLGNKRFTIVIPKLVSYWIYRVRSSIAHNKLGEYLMTNSDEEFMIEFAEPLIKEVIVHCFKN